MHEKTLLLGVDEFTLTILPSTDIEISTWDLCAKSIIYIFVNDSLIECVLDRKITLSKDAKLPGYTQVYDLGFTDYYLAIGYNEAHPGMGICVRFSAKAWAIYQACYQKKFNLTITISDFLHMVAIDKPYEIRLSRIDLTADYYNYDIDLTQMYADLRSENLVVFNHDNKNNIRSIKFFGKSNEVETIYVGSTNTNSRSYMRVYNKKAEQISNNGFRLQEALDCNNWIRFEAVYKGIYAHAITKELLEREMSKEELIQYIAHLIAQKFRFFDNRLTAYTEYTDEIVLIAEGSSFADLRCESPRDNSLKRNISHIRKGSGLFPTFYKIQELYGYDAVISFIAYLIATYKSKCWMSGQMHRELCVWLKKHDSLKELKLEDNY